ncbi:DedA family protein [Phaeacidiphilus oryzae]|jgi:membrane-associated protein|uniref:DedA family protein n=1 Tax=Phaeacidiphilus oryzae TaxID=348818 RepID=UPI0007C7FC6C|nr:DedA family protein [Phaeacidiphilus oryzae]
MFSNLAVDPMSGGSVLAAFGALGVLVVTFAESGLLVVGFLLPGDTLIFPAGVLCAGGQLSLWEVLASAAVGSFLGGQVGYEIGRRGGRPLLARSHSRQLGEGVARAERLLSRYGFGKAIVLGKFVPLARTVLGPVAGILEVPARTYLLWQAVGTLAWSQSLVLAGYYLGTSVPGVDRYLLPIVAAVVVVSAAPLLIQLVRARRARAAAGSRVVAVHDLPEKPQDPPKPKPNASGGSRLR